MSSILLPPIYDSYVPGEFYRKVLPNFTIKDPNSILCKDFASLKKLSSPRSSILVASDPNKKVVYLLGGIGVGAAGTQSTFEIYDPVADTYTKKADFPDVLHSKNAVAEVGSDGKLYVAYLVTGSIVVYFYNSVNNSWVFRNNIDTFVYGPDFMVGGISSGNIFRFFVCLYTASSFLVFDYDITTDSYLGSDNIRLGNVDVYTPFSYLKVGNLIYFVTPDSGVITALNLDNLIQSIVYNNTSALSPETGFCSNSSLLYLDGKIYIVGGYIGTTSKQYIYVYDPSLNTLVKADFVFLFCKYDCGFASLGSSGYMFGGIGAYGTNALDTSHSADMLKTEIYYTLDGSDVFDSNGVLTPSAKKYTGPFTLTLPANVNSVVTPAI